jgi:uroporphyrinogen-III synthase/uroporphyrinogen III methyltransferase/synthase
MAGRRILVTRASHQAGKLSEALRALGAEPIEVPVLEICPPASFASMDAALQRLDCYDWLVLTSANAVLALARRAAELAIGFPAALKVATVGKSTAAAARDAGLNVTIVPVSYVAESLLEPLLAHSSGQRILLARAVVARDLIPDALRQAGSQVDVVDTYQNLLPKAAPQQLRSALDAGIDAAAFTSSSSVTHLAEAAHRGGIDWPLPSVLAISIGPITSQTLCDLEWTPAAEAATFDIPGLVAAFCRCLGKS